MKAPDFSQGSGAFKRRVTIAPPYKMALAMERVQTLNHLNRKMITPLHAPDFVLAEAAPIHASPTLA